MMTLNIRNGESLIDRVTVLGLTRCRKSFALVAVTILPKTNTRIVFSTINKILPEWPTAKQDIVTNQHYFTTNTVSIKIPENLLFEIV